MPLLRQTPFSRKKIPKGLDPSVPLYYLELTGEVFTEYEEFCYRTIQCNSLVWTCAETGRSDLTFPEALESENNARKPMNSFKESLGVPALYLASIAQSASLTEIVKDVYDFMRNHLFVGENVVPKTKEKWKRGKIISVKLSKELSDQSEEKSFHNVQTNIPQSQYVYVVDTYNRTNSEIREITGDKLRRPMDTHFSKDILSTFIKQNAVLDARGVWVIKGSVLRQYNIQNVKFENIFVGEPPVFSNTFKNVGNQSKGHRKKDGVVEKTNVKDNKNSVQGSRISPTTDLTGKKTVGKLRTKSDQVIGSVQKSGQQNIEKYFFSSKKSSQDNKKYDGQKIGVQETESNAIVNNNEMCYDVNRKDEDSSYNDEIKISTKKQSTPTVHEMLRNMPETLVVVHRNEHDEDSVPTNTKEYGLKTEEFHHKKTCNTLMAKTVNLRSPKAVAELNLPEAVVNLEPMVTHTSSVHLNKKKELGNKVQKVKDKKTAREEVKGKKKVVLSVKRSWKKSSSPQKRKQKIVGTLKPWVQSTKKKMDGIAPVIKEQTLDNSTKASKEKKRNWLDVQRENELKEKMKKDEQLQLKLKQEEEKVKFAKFMKEWRKLREDLLCEDLKPLPVPCDINCQIPNDLFGDFIMILEFFTSFHITLRVKRYFPGGITFECLEKALTEADISGPLNDIIHILLSAIFDLQISEQEKPKSGIPIAVDLYLDDLYDQDMTPQEAIPHCIASTGWSQVFQGLSLQEIPLNHATISEVLRLHLLGSGGRAWDTTSKWLSQRGGFTNLDDPGLWLRIEKPSVLLRLSHNHVCELSVVEKLDILSCLINQVLTYAKVREKLDSRCELTRKARANFKSLQTTEIKLQKEVSAQRIQEKKKKKQLSLTKGLPQTNPQIDTESEKSKLEREMSKLKVDLQKKSTQILPLAMGHQLLPLGYDRAHRKYWLFSSLPGLFVEYSPFEIGPCLPKPTPRSHDLVDTLTHVKRLFREESHNCSSDKENEANDRDVKPQSASVKKMLGEQNKTIEVSSDNSSTLKEDEVTENNISERELLVCTASNDCPVHCPSTSKSHWSFFSKEDDLSVLLECLNERGVRESALRRTLNQEKQRITESISQCPLHKLNPFKFIERERLLEREPRKATRSNSSYKSASVLLNYPPGTSVALIMEWSMREFILELENKITSGCVGSLQVDNRQVWRSAIENGSYDKQCDKLVWGFKMRSSLQEQKEKESNRRNLRKTMKQGDEEEIYIQDTDIEDQEKETERESLAEDKETERESLAEDKETEMESLAEDKETERESLAEDKETERESLVEDKETERESLAEGKETERESLADDKETERESLADDKETERESLAEGKDTERESLADDKETERESLADYKDTERESSADDKISALDSDDETDNSQEDQERETGGDSLIGDKESTQDFEDEMDTDVPTNQETRILKKEIKLDDDAHESLKIGNCKIIKSETEEISEVKGESLLDSQRCSVNSGEELDHSSPDSRVILDEDLNCSVEVKTGKIQTLETHSTLVNAPPPRNPVVKDLASAILQLGQSVDPKFLQKPLVDDDGTTKTRMKYWEVSLMNTINFSQLFIHHSTLESSIKWDKSTFNAKCCSCRRRSDADKMLLCDGCNKGYHMFCLKPEINTIPSGEWYCHNCSPVEQSSKEKNRKCVVEKQGNVSDSSASEMRERKRKALNVQVNDDILAEHHPKFRKVNDNKTCKKCAQGGLLVFCTSCYVAYHSECMAPTRRPSRKQKENWQCELCKTEESSQVSTVYEEGSSSMNSENEISDFEDEDNDTMSNASSEIRKGSSGRERRGCASATIARIAAFTKKLRSNSWEDDESSQKKDEDSTSSNNTDVRRSSRRSAYASDDLPLDNAVLQDLLKEMLHHKDSWPFLRPVRKSEVPDYHKLIKRPMDLGTVKYKLNTAEYKNNQDFVADVLLVFENCFMYNRSDAIEFKCGVNMLQFFQRKCRDLGLEWKGMT